MTHFLTFFTISTCSFVKSGSAFSGFAFGDVVLRRNVVVDGFGFGSSVTLSFAACKTFSKISKSVKCVGFYRLGIDPQKKINDQRFQQ